jgi:hypothetical protein
VKYRIDQPSFLDLPMEITLNYNMQINKFLRNNIFGKGSLTRSVYHRNIPTLVDKVNWWTKAQAHRVLRGSRTEDTKNLMKT